MHEHPLGFSCEDVDDRCGDLERELAGTQRELRRVEAVRANSEQVAREALDFAKEVYGWAVHDPNTGRVLKRVTDLKARLERG